MTLNPVYHLHSGNGTNLSRVLEVVIVVAAVAISRRGNTSDSSVGAGFKDRNTYFRGLNLTMWNRALEA